MTSSKGWKLMPPEPTQEMWKIAVSMDVWPLTPKSFKRLYQAMLEIAPIDTLGADRKLEDE
jgi:hypothetical protein